jgi:cell division protein FtsZ
MVEDMTEQFEIEIEANGNTLNPKILVVGCGGAGCNSIHRLHKIGVHGASTIAINTDKLHLDGIIAHKKMLIGKNITRGQGAGGMPEVGEKCAEQAEHDLAEAVRKADMTFVIAGMGGGTGTGVAPQVSRLARKEGSIVIGIATTPFKAERGRMRNAKQGLEKFRKCADSVIVLENDKLLKVVPTLPFNQALSVMDQLISEVIKGVTEAITKPSLINLDFADVKTVVTSGGASTILYGEHAANEPHEVVAQTLNSPFMDIDYSHAKSALIHLTSGRDLSINTIHMVVDGLTSQMHENANVIFGVRHDDEDYQDVMRVITIVTGAKSEHLLHGEELTSFTN